MADREVTAVSAGRLSLAGKRWARVGLSLLAAASLSLTTVGPAYALSSTPAAPALAGLANAPAPAFETSGEGAANVSPYDVNGGGGLAALSAAPAEPKSAKFTPPDTPYNGAFTRSLPIEVPPFFELTPRLKLNYNSGDNRQHSGDSFSILGVGWSLSGGGLVERKSSRGGLPRFDTTDMFELDGNGLMDCVVEGVTRETPSCSAGGTHTARYESYERITRNSTLNSWEITARDGTLSVYRALGYFAPSGSEDARLRNDYRWLLASITDSDGNSVSYSYDCAALPTCYVSAIGYGTSTIQFYWESRTDSYTYATGISLGTVAKRLKTVAVKADTSLIRAYALGYQDSNNTKRRLLTSFKQYGSDATLGTDGAITGGTSLSSDKFSYWQMSDNRRGTMISDLVTANTAPEGTPSTTATEPTMPIVPATTASTNYVLGDFDGNGKTDYLEITRSTCQTKIRFDGLGLAIVVTGSTPAGWCNTTPAYYSVADFNGDGRSDVAVRRTIGQIPGSKPAELSGFSDSDTAIYTLYLTGTAISSYSVKGILASDIGLGAQTGDFNGDGLTDLLFKKVLVSTGSGYLTQTWGNTGEGAVGDFNADGLSDYFVVRGNSGNDSELFISGGAAFNAYSVDLNLDSNFPSTGDPAAAQRVGDLNGDGASDLVYPRVTGNGLYIVESTGYGINQVLYSVNFRPSGAVELEGDGRYEIVTDIYEDTARTREGLSNFNFASALDLWNGILSDFDGDGKPDREAGRHDPDAVFPDLMKRHTLSSGGTVDVEYLPSTYWTNGFLPMVLQVVSKVTTSDGRGGSSKVKYAYEGGAYDPFEHKFLGFAKVTAELPCETDEPTCPWVHAWYRQEAVAAGSLSKLEVYAPNGQVQRRIENGYVVNQATAPFTAFRTSEQVTDFLVGGDVTTRTEWTYDGYGNVLEEKDLGVTSSTADDVITTNAYELNLTDYLVSFPGSMTIKDTAGSVLRDAQLYYDGASSMAAPTKGHVTTARGWLSPGNRWIASTSEYDSFGNLVAQVDPLGNRTELDYDAATHQFVTETRNPLWFGGDTRQKATASWNALCAQPATATDANGLSTSFTYDALCRPTRVDYPSGEYQTTAWLNLGTPGTQYVETTRSPADGVTPIWSRTYFDGLGRTYKQTAVSADPAKPVVIETTYAKRGTPSASTAPYFQGDTPQWTSAKIDLLGRPTLITLPDSNTMTFAYEAPLVAPGAVTVKTTDPLARVSRVVLDARDNEIRRIQYLGATGVVTDFAYNPLGELVGANDPNGNAWSNSFDTLGHRITSADPDLGTWTYAYDDAGRLTTQIDAKGQQSVLTYDGLGRVLTKTSGLGLPIEEVVTYTYDEARPGFFNVGALTTAANDNAAITYDYDAGGRSTKQATTVDAVTHIVTSSFDAGGRLLSRSYPDSSSSGTFGYNAAGQAITLAGAVTGVTYAADGQTKTVAYANGVTTTYTYSATRGWLNAISAVNGATSIENLSYTRDAAGRITAVTGGRTDESWAYGYDDLDRLLSAANTNTPSLSRTYSYDVGGNLTTNSAIGTYAYPTQGSSAYQPHAVTSAGSWTFGYDLNGNQTTRHTGATLDREITYDADNRPVSVTVGGNTVAYLYGPDGERIKKLFGTDATLYLGDDVERDPTGAFTNYLTSDVKRVGGANHFLLADHQGSTRAVTDNAGTTYRVSAFEPYGKQVETVINPLTPSEPRGYIGERTDPENGLTYLHARYYDATLGRFLSPDWWDVGNPDVGTNRYAYAAGNPISLSDPSGHVMCSLVSDSCEDDDDSYASQLQPDGTFKKIKTSQLTAEREQKAAAVQAALRGYKLENGITGGITASQLNASLSSTTLTATKASYLVAMLASGTLSSTQARQVISLLMPPPAAPTGTRVGPGGGTGHLVAPIPLMRPGCTLSADACALLGYSAVGSDGTVLVAEWLGPGGGGRLFGYLGNGWGFRVDFAPNPSPTRLHIHLGPFDSDGTWGGHRPWYAPWQTW